MNFKGKMQRKSGITLISLVVTIIVLLILAGISISMLTGQNGILNRAQEAKEKTEAAVLEEKIKLAVAEAQMSNNGYEELSTENLNYELIKDGTKAIVSDNADGTKHVLFLDEKKEYKLDNNGNIEDLNIDFDTKYVAPSSQDETRNDGVIGIGTNGQVVDMDLWEYSFDSVTNGYGLNDNISLSTSSSSNASKGYNGTDFSNIVIPQYISTDNSNTWTEVTNLDWTFFNCTELIKIDKLPSTIISMRYTFRGCASLTTIFDIPINVIKLDCTFYDCSSLNYVKSIGNNVEVMRSTFFNCSSLVSIPQLPNTVYDMEQTFYGCISLTSVPNIPTCAKSMIRTFYNCINLKTVPAIPNSVNIMYQTFEECSSLTGMLIINASIVGNTIDGQNLDYTSCLKNASTNEDANLILTGSCQILDKVLSTKSENSHIQIK